MNSGKKISFRNLVFRATMLVLSILPLLVFADPPTGGGGNNPPGGGGDNPPPGITNPLNAPDLNTLLEQIVRIAGQIGFYVAVFFIIYSGFKFVQARGNPKEIQDAKTMFLWAVIGTAVLLGAWIFARAIQGTINAL